MTIRPKSPQEQDNMREGGKRLNEILEQMFEFIQVGQSLIEIDQAIANKIKTLGGEPSFLGFHDYPASSCLSVNQAVVHGIPTHYRLQAGDVLGIDIGFKYENYHTDAAFTVLLGQGAPEKEKLLAVTQESLKIGLEAAVAGNQVKDIGSSIETYVSSQGKYGIIRDLAGHGVGAGLQEIPEILNYHNRNTAELINGMTIAIEPMISLGDWHVELEDDSWTVVTRDSSPAAHFETTLIIRDNDPEVLVPFPLSSALRK